MLLIFVVSIINLSLSVQAHTEGHIESGSESKNESGSEGKNESGSENTDLLAQAIQTGKLHVEQRIHTAWGAKHSISVLKVELAPSFKEPQHTHPGEEILYIVSGEGQLWQNGIPKRFESGDILHVKAGVKKALQNTSPKDKLRVIAYLVLENNKPPLNLVP